MRRRDGQRSRNKISQGLYEASSGLWKSFSSATRRFSVQRRGREIRENACIENFSSASPDGAQLRVTESTSVGEISCYFYLLHIFMLQHTDI